MFGRDRPTARTISPRNGENTGIRPENNEFRPPIYGARGCAQPNAAGTGRPSASFVGQLANLPELRQVGNGCNPRSASTRTTHKAQPAQFQCGIS
jgi:hypothetical protein